MFSQREVTDVTIIILPASFLFLLKFNCFPFGCKSAVLQVKTFQQIHDRRSNSRERSINWRTATKMRDSFLRYNQITIIMTRVWRLRRRCSCYKRGSHAEAKKSLHSPRSSYSTFLSSPEIHRPWLARTNFEGSFQNLSIPWSSNVLPQLYLKDFDQQEYVRTSHSSWPPIISVKANFGEFTICQVKLDVYQL